MQDGNYIQIENVYFYIVAFSHKFFINKIAHIIATSADCDIL